MAHVCQRRFLLPSVIARALQMCRKRFEETSIHELKPAIEFNRKQINPAGKESREFCVIIKSIGNQRTRTEQIFHGAMNERQAIENMFYQFLVIFKTNSRFIHLARVSERMKKLNKKNHNFYRGKWIR